MAKVNAARSARAPSRAAAGSSKPATERTRAMEDQAAQEAARIAEDARAAEAFAVLGIAASSTVSQIRTAYKRAALDTHPDKREDEGAFQSIQDAYETLITISTQRAKEREAERRAACEVAYAVWEEQRTQRQLQLQPQHHQQGQPAPATQRAASPGQPGFQPWERPAFRPQTRAGSLLKSGRGATGTRGAAPAQLTGAPFVPPGMLALEC